MQGKIRVSVVATGVDSGVGTGADAAAARPAEPQRATFSFSAPRTGEVAPAAAAGLDLGDDAALEAAVARATPSPIESGWFPRPDME